MAALKTTATGLSAWDGAEADVLGAVARVSGHPRFADASRALAAGMLSLAAEDRVLDSVFKDAGRYFAAMTAYALHDQGGFTLPALKAICVRSGLLSPGRARAMLRFLEHCRYVERQPGGLRGADIYAPTPAFLAAWDRHFIVSLEAASLIAPDISGLLEPSGYRLRQTYGRIHAGGMLAAMQSEPVVTAFLRVFLHPFAGNHTVWTLIGAAPGFPPHRAGPVSIAGLARTSGTSRAQVARIFREAAAEGLTELGVDGMVTFLRSARQEIGFFYAIQLVQILVAASQAARLHDAGLDLPATAHTA
jgi:hypothetical protein